MSFRSALYRGELMHARHDDIARRAFRYGVYVASLDLDELPELDRELRLFSVRKRNAFTFDDRDYAAALSPGVRVAAASETAAAGATDSLRDSLAALRAANGLPTPASTRLVTNLRTFGYAFNPVSFFLDYDARGALTSVIAEVNNTYGGRFRYVLGAAHRIVTGDALDSRASFRHVRELFVSPFLHGPATYDFHIDAPLDAGELVIDMHVHRGVVANGARPERLFTARLTGSRIPLSDRALAWAALRYPLMSARVIGLIHFEALKMRLAGVPYRRPERDHRPLDATTR